MRKLGKLTLEEQEMDDAVGMATAPEEKPAPDFDAIAADMDGVDEGDGDDVVMFNVPALIRTLEHAREDFEGEHGDTELHEFAEMLMGCCKDKEEPITVQDLEDMFEEEEAEDAAEMHDDEPYDEGGEPPAEFGGEDEESDEEEEEEEEEDEDEDEGMEEGMDPEGENISEASKCPKEMGTDGKGKKKDKKKSE